MNIEGIVFPDKVVAFLLRHKEKRHGALPDNVFNICRDQVVRAHKRMEVIETILGYYQLKSVLDIGCGLAMIDILIQKKFHVPLIHLFDGDGTDELYEGYNKKAKPAWNDVMLAGEMVKANVPTETVVVPHFATELATIPCDALVSFKSWGVHYPISTYVPLALRSVKDGGLLLTEIDDPAGEQLLTEHGFKVMDRIGRRLIAFERVE